MFGNETKLYDLNPICRAGNTASSSLLLTGSLRSPLINDASGRESSDRIRNESVQRLAEQIEA